MSWNCAPKVLNCFSMAWSTPGKDIVIAPRDLKVVRVFACVALPLAARNIKKLRLFWCFLGCLFCFGLYVLVCFGKGPYTKTWTTKGPRQTLSEGPLARIPKKKASGLHSLPIHRVFSAPFCAYVRGSKTLTYLHTGTAVSSPDTFVMAACCHSSNSVHHIPGKGAPWFQHHATKTSNFGKSMSKFYFHFLLLTSNSAHDGNTGPPWACCSKLCMRHPQQMHLRSCRGMASGNLPVEQL